MQTSNTSHVVASSDQTYILSPRAESLLQPLLDLLNNQRELYPYQPSSELRVRILLLLAEKGTASIEEIYLLERYGFKRTAIRKALQKMAASGIINKVSRATYSINTEYLLQSEKVLEILKPLFPYITSYRSDTSHHKSDTSKCHYSKKSVTSFKKVSLAEKECHFNKVLDKKKNNSSADSNILDREYKIVKEVLTEIHDGEIDEIDIAIAYALWRYWRERGRWYLQDAEDLGIDQALKEWLQKLSRSSSNSSIKEASSLPLYEINNRIRKLLGRGVLYCFCRARKIRLGRHISNKILERLGEGI